MVSAQSIKPVWLCGGERLERNVKLERTCIHVGGGPTGGPSPLPSNKVTRYSSAMEQSRSRSLTAQSQDKREADV